MTAVTREELRAVVDGVRQIAKTERSVASVSDGGYDVDVWHALEAAGFASERDLYGASAPERTTPLMLGVARALAEQGAVVPYVDAVALGAWLTEAVGLSADAAMVVPLVDANGWHGAGFPATGKVRRTPAGWTLSMDVAQVPWARIAGQGVFLDVTAGLAARVRFERRHISPGKNLAGEPMDRIALESAPVEVEEIDGPAMAEALLLRGAMFRAVSMCGAMDAILRTTIAYVTSREQFGGPLVRLGAVQQLLAELAAETVLVDAVIETMVQESASTGRPSVPLSVIAAKARSSRAAGTVVAIAHQLHGAMGVTMEYPLAAWTRRLLAWRDEYGSEQYWERRIGKTAAQLPTEVLWDGIVTAGAAWDDTGQLQD